MKTILTITFTISALLAPLSGAYSQDKTPSDSTAPVLPMIAPALPSSNDNVFDRFIIEKPDLAQISVTDMINPFLPYTAIGLLTFTDPRLSEDNHNRQCTAYFLGDANTIATAALCLRDHRLGSTGEYFTDFKFEGFDSLGNKLLIENGNPAANGEFTAWWAHPKINSTTLPHNAPYNYGFFRVSRKVPDSNAPFLGFGFDFTHVSETSPNQVRAVGYSSTRGNTATPWSQKSRVVTFNTLDCVSATPETDCLDNKELRVPKHVTHLVNTGSIDMNEFFAVNSSIGAPLLLLTTNPGSTIPVLRPYVTSMQQGIYLADIEAGIFNQNPAFRNEGNVITIGVPLSPEYQDSDFPADADFLGDYRKFVAGQLNDLKNATTLQQ